MIYKVADAEFALEGQFAHKVVTALLLAALFFLLALTSAPIQASLYDHAPFVVTVKPGLTGNIHVSAHPDAYIASQAPAHTPLLVTNTSTNNWYGIQHNQGALLWILRDQTHYYPHTVVIHNDEMFFGSDATTKLSSALDCTQVTHHDRVYICTDIPTADLQARKNLISSLDGTLSTRSTCPRGDTRGKGHGRNRGWSSYVCRARRVLRLPGNVWRITRYHLHPRRNACIMFINYNYGGHEYCSEFRLVDLPNIRWIYLSRL